MASQKCVSWTLIASFARSIGIGFIKCLDQIITLRIFNNNAYCTDCAKNQSKIMSTKCCCEKEIQIDHELRIARWVQESKQWNLHASENNSEAANTYRVNDVSFIRCRLSWRNLACRRSTWRRIQQSNRQDSDQINLKSSLGSLEERRRIIAMRNCLSSNSAEPSPQPQTISAVHAWFIPMVCARCSRQTNSALLHAQQ